MEANMIADFGCPLFGARAWTACRIGLAGTRCSRELSRTVMQAVSVEGDGLAVSRQARRMHVAADDRLHRQPVAASIHRPYQPRERDGSMPLSTHGRNDRSMAAGMRDAHPWQGQVAGRMNRAGRAVPADDVGLARPDGDQAVSRCIGSEVGAGIPQCIRRYMDTEQGARIQTPGLAHVGQLAGARRAPLAAHVCQCNVGASSGIPRGVARDAVDRGMERWRLASLVVSQSQHGHPDDGRGCNEADSGRHQPSHAAGAAAARPEADPIQARQPSARRRGRKLSLMPASARSPGARVHEPQTFLPRSWPSAPSARPSLIRALSETAALSYLPQYPGRDRYRGSAAASTRPPTRVAV
jgi:hypothetical protein